MHQLWNDAQWYRVTEFKNRPGSVLRFGNLPLKLNQHGTLSDLREQSQTASADKALRGPDNRSDEKNQSSVSCENAISIVISQGISAAMVSHNQEENDILGRITAG
jgi:hypothetical protein